MEIIFYVALWMLSGFLAAWVAHKLDEAVLVNPRDTTIRAVFWMTLGGCLTLVLVAIYTIFQSDVMSKPFFKAKEPK